jgi:hypothetical protein
MKKRLPLVILIIVAYTAFGQDSGEKTMENRAREFYRVIGLTDKNEYKKFMQENYTKAFLEKPVKMSRIVSEGDNTSSSEEKPKDNLEAKTQMYAQLHDDFGGSKIVSVKQKENKVDMVLKSSSGLTGTFTFTFDKAKPYLIDGLGVQAEMEN